MRTASRRAFTLVELIVILVVLAVLAAIAVLSFSHFTARARVVAAQATLRQVVDATLLASTQTHGILSADLVADALTADTPGASVHEGQSAAQVWDLLDPTTTPTSINDLSVAFDDGPTTALSAHSGTRMMVVTGTGDGRTVAILVPGTDAGLCTVPVDEPTAAGPLLARTAYCPTSSSVDGGDTSAPTPPTDVTAAVHGSNVDLTWAKSSDDVGVVVYEVHRSTTASFTPSADTLVGLSVTQSLSDTPTSGTWFYKVVAYDAAGNHAASGAVTVDAYLPLTPAITGTLSDDGTSTITWAAIDHASGYVVQSSIDGTDWTTSQLPATTKTATVDLQPGSRVLWRVASIVLGEQGDYSDVLVHTRTTTAPTLTGTLDGTKATVTWAAVGTTTRYEVRYRLRDSDGVGAWVEATTSSTTATYATLQDGQAIEWQAATTGAGGTSDWSATYTLTRPGTPHVALTQADGQVTATWAAPFGADTYEVRSALDGGAWVLTPTTKRTASVEVPAGSSLLVQVRAVADGQVSPWSDLGSYTAAPSTPSLNASITEATSTASWTPAAGATSYLVRYQIDDQPVVTATTSATGASVVVPEGAQISWQVAASNAGGSSPYSTVLILTRPAVPVLTSTYSSGVLSVSWPAAHAATGYDVRISTDSGAWVNSSTTATHVDVSIAAGSSVLVQVRSTNPVSPSSWSDVAVYTRTPAMPVLTGAYTTGKSAVSWPAVGGATSYQVRYRLASGTWVTATTTGTSVSYDTYTSDQIDWQVAATNAAGSSDWSATLTMIVPAAPAPTSTLSGATMTTTWSPVAGATTYEVATSSDAGATWTTATTAATTASATVTPGASVMVKVRAIGTWATSAWSSTTSQTRNLAAPTATGAYNDTTRTWTLSWPAVDGATGYEVATLSGSTWSTVATQTGTSWTTTLSVGGTATAKVRATYGSVLSPYSTQLSQQAKTAAPVATGSFTESTGTWSLSWAAVTGASSYTLSVQVGGGTSTYPSTTATSYNGTIPYGSSVTVMVQAVNSANVASAWSNSATYTRRPATPASISVSRIWGHKVTVTWPAAVGATAYKVYDSLTGTQVQVSGTTTTIALPSTATGQSVAFNVTSLAGTTPAAGYASVTERMPSATLYLSDAHSGVGRGAGSAGADTRWDNSIVSANGKWALVLQNDGNLVAYNTIDNYPYAASDTSTATRFAWQGDGNVVLYTAANAAVRFSDTYGRGADHFGIQDDGNIVIWTASGGALYALSWTTSNYGQGANFLTLKRNIW